MSPDRVDAVFAALSDPTRRQMMLAISDQGEASATELAQQLPISRQAVAKHLAALAEAGLVTADIEGRHKRYRLTPAPLSDAVSWIAEVGAEWDTRLDDLQKALRRRRHRT